MTALATRLDHHPKPLQCNHLANIPQMGIFIPNMGIQAGTGHAGALFSPVQQRLLAVLFGAPDRQVQSAELIRLVDGGTGATHRQLLRLAESGIISAQRMGSQKFYQANRASPIFAEILGIVRKTFGLVEPLREALMPAADALRVAFVYGSVAAGTDTDQSDIDLMVLSESLTYADVFELLQPLEHELGRTIHPTVVDPARWSVESQEADSFLGRVARGAILPVIGSIDVAG